DADSATRRGAARTLLEAGRRLGSLDRPLRIRNRRGLLRQLPPRFSRALHTTHWPLGADGIRPGRRSRNPWLLRRQRHGSSFRIAESDRSRPFRFSRSGATRKPVRARLSCSSLRTRIEYALAAVGKGGAIAGCARKRLGASRTCTRVQAVAESAVGQ